MPAVSEILTQEDLTLLRGLFDNQVMTGAALAAVAGTYSRAAPWTKLVLDQFYDEDAANQASLDPDHRRVMPRADVERVLIGIMAANRCDWGLALHVYWGMCVAEDPLDPSEIAEIILLAATYGGAQVQTEGMAVLMGTLAGIKGQLEQAKKFKARDKQVAVAGVLPIVGLLTRTLFPIVST